jgi:hypothetical protein
VKDSVKCFLGHDQDGKVGIVAITYADAGKVQGGVFFGKS